MISELPQPLCSPTVIFHRWCELNFGPLLIEAGSFKIKQTNNELTLVEI